MAKPIQPPEISLQMTYSEEDAMLVVHANRVSSLPRRKDGKKHNTYVRQFLVPKFPEVLPRQPRSSEIKREDNNPVFSQKVEYESISAHELINSVLHIEVLEYSCFEKHHVLGETDLHLVHVHFVQGEVALTLPLDIPRTGENYGTVLISLAYMQDTHKLNVWLIQGKDLTTRSDKETDIRAKLWLTINGEQILDEKHTKTVTTSCSPYFSDEKFSWRLEPSLIQNIAVHIAVLNQHPKSPDRRHELGHVTISKLQSSWTERMHWANFINSPDRPITEWHKLVKDEKTKEDECKASFAQLSVQLEYKNVKEILTVKIGRANWNQKPGALVNSFVRLAIIPQLSDIPARADQRTHSIITENSATFNEEVEYEAMNMEEFYNSILRVELVDYRFIEDSKIVGQKCLQLSEVPLEQGKAGLNLLLESPTKPSSALVSLAYNHGTKTINISLLMAKDLNHNNSQETDAMAKIQITDGNKVYGEVTTKTRPQTCTPVFSETLTCHMEAPELRHTVVRITILNDSSSAGCHQLGEVLLCRESEGEALKHWNKFLSELDRPHTYWHVLSQETDETSVKEDIGSPLDRSKVLPQSTRKDVRHRSALVTEADKDAWKQRQRPDYQCKRTVFNMLQNIEKQRPWSDLIQFPESIMESQESIMESQEYQESIDTAPKNTGAELSLHLTYNEAGAILTVKIEKALALQFPVFADLLQERLARIAQGVPVNAMACLYLQPSLATVPLRKSKKTSTKKLKKETVFAEEVQFESIGIEELDNFVLHVGVLGCNFEKVQVLGHAQLTLADVPVKDEEVAATLPLHRPVKEKLGSVRISLLYQHDNNELVVILLRAKELNNRNSIYTDAQARIWIASSTDDILGETYSNTTEKSCSPYFNETLSVAVEPSQIRNVAIHISVQNKSGSASRPELGQVTLSSRSTGEEYRHWNDTIASPGDRLMEWHELHSCSDRLS